MTKYALQEIVLVILAAVVLIFIWPKHWMTCVWWIAVAYSVLSVASRRAFHRAADRGFVFQSLTLTTRFILHPLCPAKWLVKRYIRVVPAAHLTASISTNQ